MKVMSETVGVMSKTVGQPSLRQLCASRQQPAAPPAARTASAQRGGTPLRGIPAHASANPKRYVDNVMEIQAQQYESHMDALGQKLHTSGKAVNRQRIGRSCSAASV